MRAKPIFTYSLLAGALALPVTRSALGLGKLTVESGARAAAVGADRAHVGHHAKTSIRCARRIADPTLYRQNNLTYQGTLSRARISLEGGPTARRTCASRRRVSVQEPFLDLLVELNWASGRVVREYTFLLDPPGLPRRRLRPSP